MNRVSSDCQRDENSITAMIKEAAQARCRVKPAGQVAVQHVRGYGYPKNCHGNVPVSTVNGIKHASLAMRQPQDWLAACRQNGHGWQLRELTAASAAEEAVMLGLRLVEGRPLAELAAQGVMLDGARLAALQQDGLLSAQKDVLQATEKGRLLLDYIIARLLA